MAKEDIWETIDVVGLDEPFNVPKSWSDEEKAAAVQLYIKQNPDKYRPTREPQIVGPSALIGSKGLIPSAPGTSIPETTTAEELIKLNRPFVRGGEASIESLITGIKRLSKPKGLFGLNIPLGAAGIVGAPSAGLGEAAGTTMQNILATAGLEPTGVVSPTAAALTNAGIQVMFPFAGIEKFIKSFKQALPMRQTKAVEALSKLMPQIPKAEAFAKLPESSVSLIPLSHNLSKRAIQYLKDELPAFERLEKTITQKSVIDFKAADAMQKDLRKLSNKEYNSPMGNPTIGDELNNLRSTLVNMIDVTNPGYKAALEASKRTAAVQVLKRMVVEETNPERAIKSMIQRPVSHNEKLIMSAFDDDDIKAITYIFERLPSKMSLRQLWESRLAGRAVVGALLGGLAGKTAEFGLEAGTLGGIAVMAMAPTGRRILMQIAQQGGFEKPEVWQTLIPLANMFNRMHTAEVGPTEQTPKR